MLSYGGEEQDTLEHSMTHFGLVHLFKTFQYIQNARLNLGRLEARGGRISSLWNIAQRDSSGSKDRTRKGACCETEKGHFWLG